MNATDKQSYQYYRERNIRDIKNNTQSWKQKQKKTKIEIHNEKCMTHSKEESLEYLKIVLFKKKILALIPDISK